MNPTREIQQTESGMLVASLTPEEQAKMDELYARREKIETALCHAKRKAKKARQSVSLFKAQLKIVNGKLWQLEKIRFPEF
jgi:hypothetical protein